VIRHDNENSEGRPENDGPRNPQCISNGVQETPEGDAQEIRDSDVGGVRKTGNDGVQCSEDQGTEDQTIRDNDVAGVAERGN